MTQLHPAADSRRSFEEKLRADVHKLVEGMWREAARVEFDFKGHELVTEAPYEVRASCGPCVSESSCNGARCDPPAMVLVPMHTPNSGRQRAK